MASEKIRIEKLFHKLSGEPLYRFPPKGGRLIAPCEHGVYVIKLGKKVAHVGRSIRGKDGLKQRLRDHLGGRSSFTMNYVNGGGSGLRGKFVYRYLVVEDDRLRALLEAYAIGQLCPKHLGLGR